MFCLVFRVLFSFLIQCHLFSLSPNVVYFTSPGQLVTLCHPVYLTPCTNSATHVTDANLTLSFICLSCHSVKYSAFSLYAICTFCHRRQSYSPAAPLRKKPVYWRATQQEVCLAEARPTKSFTRFNPRMSRHLHQNPGLLKPRPLPLTPPTSINPAHYLSKTLYRFFAT